MISLGRLGRVGSITSNPENIGVTGAAFASNAFDGGAFHTI